MCPSKLNLQPQQPKCLTQYLPAFLGSSWEASWHVPASSAMPGIPSLHIPALLLRALQLQHLHQSPSLGEPLRHCCSTWGCPCPRSLLQDLQPLQTAGQHKCTEERTRITLGFPQSQPHPAAGHGSTHHRTSLHILQLSPSHLAGVDVLSMVLPKSLPREVVSVLARKSLHPRGVNTGFSVLPTNQWLNQQLFTPLLTPATQPEGQGKNHQQQWLLGSLLLTARTRLCPNNWRASPCCSAGLAPATAPAADSVFRCFSQMMSLLSPAASVICSIFYSRYLELLL